MWSLLFVLIVGGYWLFRLTLDKASTEVFNEAYDKSQKILEPLCAPRELINELMSQLDDPKRRWDVLRTVSNELRQIYGDNWGIQFKEGGFTGGSTCMTTPWSIALSLVSAKKGYILGRTGEYILGHKPEELRRNQIKACHMIEKFMQESHPDLNLRLVFVPGIDIEDPTARKPVPVYRDEIWAGKLIWNFEVLPKQVVREVDFW
ncbi:hypothetical protein [Agathobacter sp.]